MHLSLEYSERRTRLGGVLKVLLLLVSPVSQDWSPQILLQNVCF